MTYALHFVILDANPVVALLLPLDDIRKTHKAIIKFLADPGLIGFMYSFNEAEEFTIRCQNKSVLHSKGFDIR